MPVVQNRQHKNLFQSLLVPGASSFILAARVHNADMIEIYFFTELPVRMGPGPPTAPQIQRHRRRPPQLQQGLLLLTYRLADEQKASGRHQQGQNHRPERPRERLPRHVPEGVSMSPAAFRHLFHHSLYRHYKFLYIIFAIGIPIAVPIYGWNETFINSLFVSYFARYILQLHATWLINSAAHLYGTKPYDKYDLRKPSSRLSYRLLFLQVHESRGESSYFDDSSRGGMAQLPSCFSVRLPGRRVRSKVFGDDFRHRRSCVSGVSIRLEGGERRCGQNEGGEERRRKSSDVFESK